ncbi:MAG TPA: CHAT domain-containing protein [Thermoanaerobaculia bacterium]|nr:CHAT domain-containing protein [Thermoanaerobaculia bacterium]
MPLLFLLLLGGTAAAPTPEAVYQQARAAAAPQAIRIALAAFHRFGESDDEWVWRLRALCADHLTNAGRAAEARNVLKRFPASRRGAEVEVKVLEAMAYAAQRLDDPAASTFIARAYDLAKAKHPKTLGSVCVMRAIVDPANELRWGREAVKYSMQAGDAATELRARGTIAFAYAKRERFDEAIADWEPLVPLARKLGKSSMVQKIEGNLGWAYMELGDYEMAADLLTRAHAKATQAGMKYDAVPWTYQIGNVRMQQEDLAAAGNQYRAALQLAKDTKHPQKPIVLAYLANHALRSGRLAEAQQYCDESLRDAKAAKAVDDELRALLIAGRIATAAGKYDDAERHLKNVLARAKKSLSTTLEAHGRLAQLYAKRGNAAAAKEHFALSIAKASEARASIDDPELRFSFFTAVAELFDANVEFHVAHGDAAGALAVTEASRAQTLEDALPEVVKTRDARTLARDTRSTILCYWLGSTRSYLWIVTPQKIDVVPLPPKRTIEAAVEAYKRDLLGTRSTLALSSERGIALWRMLVEPASRAIAPRSRVIIVPDGALHAFNMETLVVPAPQPHYWIDDAVLSTAASLGLLLRHERKRSAAPRVLIVGNPPPPAREFVPLPRAGMEIAKVARHFPRERSTILQGAKATPSAYRHQSPDRYSFLHFVAHGVATRRKPLDSAIVLAREGEGESFKLYARDIVQQPLNAQLVTISSCHGAGRRTYAGEGLVGFGWAFLRAGSDNVVAALWEVSDAATPDLMDEFYRSLAKGTDPATALRAAKLSLRGRGGVFARPLYWAPFLLYGSS